MNETVTVEMLGKSHIYMYVSMFSNMFNPIG
jgi:hypothetical protein